MKTLITILTDKGASMLALGIFSMTALPFSLKFLLAPFLDAVNIQRLFNFSTISKNSGRGRLTLSP
jgi:Acetyl-coenzyme A transporter 1